MTHQLVITRDREFGPHRLGYGRHQCPNRDGCTKCWSMRHWALSCTCNRFDTGIIDGANQTANRDAHEQWKEHQHANTPQRLDT